MVTNTLILPHMANFIIVIYFQDLSKFPKESINLYHLISKIRLRVTRRAIIRLNNFPLELNQLTHHQIFSAAVVLHTASSIRVMQPYHFTTMLVVSHAVFQAVTTTELTPASSAPVWKICFQERVHAFYVFAFVVSMVVILHMLDRFKYIHTYCIWDFCERCIPAFRIRHRRI